VFEHKSIHYVERPAESIARANRKVRAQAATMLLPEAFVEETEARWFANERSLKEHIAKRRHSVARDWREVRRWLQMCSEADLAEWHRRWAYLPHMSCYAADAVFQIEKGKAVANASPIMPGIMPESYAEKCAKAGEKHG
jgi:hypothetical protein